MAFVLITEPPSRELYDKVVASLDFAGGPPKGLIVHTASEVDGRVRVVDVWESEEDASRFERETLLPAIEAATGGPVDGPPPGSQRFETFDIRRGA